LGHENANKPCAMGLKKKKKMLSFYNYIFQHGKKTKVKNVIVLKDPINFVFRRRRN